MSTVFDYLAWRGDLTMDKDPLNEVDGMILSRFAYVPFEYFQNPLSAEFLPLKEIAAQAEQDEALRTQNRWMLQDREMLAALRESARFSCLQAGLEESVFATDSQTQFSAVTVKLDPGRYALCFRGTDNTLIGWKENLNMSFLCPVPAQKKAVEYVQRAAKAVPGRLILCGHSKGGNLAVYAASFCGSAVQERVDAVYNYDGPGFFDQVLQQEGFLRIQDRIRTYVPQFSVVGMLLGHPEGRTVVHSTQTGLMQHDTYSWQVQGASFCRDTVTDGSLFVDATLKQWTADMSPAQFEKLVDAIYLVLSDTRMRTMQQMRDNWPETAARVVRSFTGMDEKTRDAVFEALKLLARSAGREAREAISADQALLWE